MNKEMTDEEFYSIQDIEELVDMLLTKDHNYRILQSQLDQANKKLDKIKEYIKDNPNEVIKCSELLSIIDMNNKEKLDSSEGE